jgi:small-conductance mechanosensitive channel
VDLLAVWPLAAGSAVFLAGLALGRILFSRFARWAAKTRWSWDDLAVQAFRGPFVLWSLMAAIYVGVDASPASERVVQLSGKALQILWILSITLVALRLADRLIQRYAARLTTELPLTSLTQNLVKGFILVVGALIVMNGLGVSITPILTALGVGGLAVALALQETLSNLFAGIYVTVSQQVRVGDYIKLDSGEEGHVVDIGWRSTRLQSLPNNWIVIPNTKLAQAVVTNFDLPSRDLAVLVEVGVDYRSDLTRVDRVTCEVGKEVMKEVAGGVPAFEPFIRFHTFADSSVRFTVILRAKSFVDQYLIKHEFIKRLHRRYREEGIAIPFPIRTVILEKPAEPSPLRGEG